MAEPVDEVLPALAACLAEETPEAVLTRVRPVLRPLAPALTLELGAAGELVVGGAEPAGDPRLAAALDVVRVGLARLSAEERLADLTARVDNAQQLANMGDYDWHIASDTNRWSDQLYRIYGHQPQEFNASYERFLSHIHPDDRERITSIHQEAYRTGRPYEMIERIVRPDGEVRYLASNGQVVQDDAGVPVRMRGTCIDITDRVLAEQERERSAARFRALVEASPDAILVIGSADSGSVVQANGRAGELFGGDPVGRPAGALLGGRGEQAELGVAATGVDGRTLLLDVIPAELPAGARAVFVRDAAVRLASESTAATLREVQVRRRQALEINDNVVQAMTAAAYALEVDERGDAAAYLDRAMAGARHLMNDWLNPPDGRDLEAGDLVRTSGSTLEAPAAEAAPAEPPPGTRARIVVVDDNDDVRRLIRLQIDRLQAYDVVGEAADGAEAVETVAALQPDVVFLDLAMPVMDGLEALPLIRQRAPGSRVIVLSGFDEATIGAKALRAGAVRYVEKGLRLDFRQIIEDVLDGPGGPFSRTG